MNTLPNTSKRNFHDIVIVIITIIVCAVIGGVVVYHIQSNRQSYLRGVSDGLNVHSVQDLQNIIVK